ncbi:kynureninase [Phytoactinopolyspora alkaliphila]|uniref:Kynureninase n=1 Tax=Phytoactinopolyspora alkaliphila TaxID=1783498 RepID=A0A6N9YI55_9ACTN|nr:kynureninase [Phytoactinopolyspora alkaliphila]NED94600.1 kynureninase [Phytoactinopolyspora alkaliphila]
MIALDQLRSSPNALASHYSRFRVSERLLLTGHSHQAWPDVAVEGQLEALDDAARHVDAKWDRAAAKAEEVAAGFRTWLGDPGAEIALGASTHELVVRFLSALDLRRRPRLVTTDGEFHSVRRQLARLGEEDIEVVRIAAEPVGTLAARLAEEVDAGTSAVLVSMVLFETSRIVPGLDELATACADDDVELLVDAYHALGVVPVSLPAMGLSDAWVVGGGYKYLQLGEGNCFLRIPQHADRFRPVVTGWYAEFGELADEPDPRRVSYPTGAGRFAGSTYDPTSHYRAARVFRSHDELGLTPTLLHEVSRHQVGVLMHAFDELGFPEDVITRDRSVTREAFAGFMALRCADAQDRKDALAARGVLTDSRGPYLRFGPAPYLSDDQLREAVAALAV